MNIDGGAIALGHPLGATGARITAKAAQILARGGGRYALATQCIGGGQGIATIIERPGPIAVRGRHDADPDGDPPAVSRRPRGRSAG